MSDSDKLRPNFACNVACRVVWLRQKLKSFPLDIQRQLAPFTAELPWEKELLSGKMAEVETAIAEIERMHIAQFLTYEI